MTAEPTPTPTPTATPPRRWLDWRILPVLAVTALVLWLLVQHTAGAQAFVQAVQGASWRLVPLAFLFLALNLGLAALRWQLIMAAMGHHVPLGRCLDAILSTWPLALIIPARAGDVLRALAVRDRIPTLEGAGSVVVEKAIDVQSLCLLSIAGTLAHGFYGWTVLPVVLFVAEWTFLFLVVRHRARMLGLPLIRRVAGKVMQLTAALEALMRSPRYLLAVVATSLSSWVLATAIVQVLLEATGAAVAFGESISLWPIAIFAGMLPVTVAGMGTRDALFVYALGATAGVVRQEAVLAATIGYSLVATWALAVVGLPFAIRFALALRQRPVMTRSRA